MSISNTYRKDCWRNRPKDQPVEGIKERFKKIVPAERFCGGL